MNFYHIIIETTDKIGKRKDFEKLYEFDIPDLEKIKVELVIPYLNKEPFHFKGYFIQPQKIRRFAIKQTNQSIEMIRDIEQNKVSRNVLFFYTKEMIVDSDELVKDVSSDVFNSTNTSKENVEKKNINEVDMNKIFIVHGHDDAMKSETARFIEKLGFEPIILHEQANTGLTIIEKIEKYSNVGFGIVLYSPCDVGSENKEGAERKLRARQNVVFEHGYLIGKIGREHVCALVKDDIETPGDISGVVYINYSDISWMFHIGKELKNLGYDVDMNKI